MATIQHNDLEITVNIVPCLHPERKNMIVSAEVTLKTGDFTVVIRDCRYFRTKDGKDVLFALPTAKATDSEGGHTFFDTVSLPQPVCDLIMKAATDEFLSVGRPH